MLRAPDETVKGSHWNRWFMSNAWVVEPSRIRLTLAMPAASGELTLNELPYLTTEGAAVMVGRAPLKRYGGEKISAFRWSGPASPLPAVRTRPSGSRIAVEW